MFFFLSPLLEFVWFQYLEENVHQTYVDVGVMARHLQEKYREYGRRKHQPFRFLVDQGMNIKFHPLKPNLILDYY